MYYSKSKKEETNDDGITEIDKNADSYSMSNYKRGHALILNHYEFDNTMLESRDGTEKDVAALEETLQLLKFDVTVCNDSTYAEIYDKLNEGRPVAILTHTHPTSSFFQHSLLS